MSNPINNLFENILNENEYVDQHNFLVAKLAPELVGELTINHTDSMDEMKKKRKKAKEKIKNYGFFYPLYPRVIKTGEQPAEEPTPPTDSGDTGGETGAGEGGVDEIKPQNKDNAFAYPYSIGPEHDDEFINNEALSSTERMRRYNRRHPEKVRNYLKKTQDDRVARNRDRKKAVKKYGKSKMKNHDVHHPNGAKNGNWKLARKDHGRDKKNEGLEYVYLSELYEGNVPNGPWQLISEGGAAGHLAHPYEDDTLKFSDVKEMIKRGLVGGLDAEAPVTEKLDGQNIMFSVRDGQVVFARNKGQVKNKAKNALPAADLRQMFAGRGNVEKAFGGAADDITKAIQALPQEERDQMFADGSKFMNVEIIFPDTKNVIPYDKSVLVFHGTVKYDEEGNEIGRDIEDSKKLSDQITKVNAQQQKTFGISGPRSIAFSDADTARNKEKMQDYGAALTRLQQEFDLDDKNTLEDYKIAWWERELTRQVETQGLELSEEQFNGLVKRWATGDKKAIGVKDFEDPETKKWFRQFEATELTNSERAVTRPLESIFLKVGADTLRRVTNTLSANNPELTASLKKELLDTIKSLQDTDDINKLAKLQTQIERLDDIGIDNVVPSEGLVFIYNGKPYKFTGTFAPVNQILGTLKFAKGKAEEAPVEEPKKEPEAQKTEPTPVGERKIAAIFTGRFQPFHAGHYSIYQAMVKKFGKDNVYIASSDKTDATKSPFGFKDKKEIMTRMFGIPDDNVIQVKNPYAPSEVLSKLPPDAVYVTAVSQKDADRLGGKYFKPYEEVPEKDLKGYADQGYFIVAPEMQLQIDGKNISGTQLRSVMGNPNITDRAKQEIFTKVYGKFDKKIFDKIVKVTTDSEEALKLTQTHGKDVTAPKMKQKPKVTPTKSPKDMVSNVPPAKRQTLAKVLKQKVRNPKTDRDIFVGTALKYDKKEPVYTAAMSIVKKAISN
jgi:hypothetical protein